MSKGSRQRPYNRDTFNNNKFWDKSDDDSNVVKRDSSQDSGDESPRTEDELQPAPRGAEV